MLVVTGLGGLAEARAGADALDLDPSPAGAVSWFEEGGGKFRLEAYADDGETADEIVALIAAAAPGLAMRVEPVADADWVAMALDGLPPVRAGRFFVAGAHALAHAPAAAERLWIEASEAFGTGHHGTTKGCLLALDALLKKGYRPRACIDVGAGSGVLALAAGKIGARALGVELDARAAAIAQENIRNNRMAARVRVLAADGARIARAHRGGADLVFANILMRPLLRLAGPIAGAVRPGGYLILSGILESQQPLIVLAYRARGLLVRRRIRREGWATLVFRRPRERRVGRS